MANATVAITGSVFWNQKKLKESAFPSFRSQNFCNKNISYLRASKTVWWNGYATRYVLKISSSSGGYVDLSLDFIFSPEICVEGVIICHIDLQQHSQLTYFVSYRCQLQKHSTQCTNNTACCGKTRKTDQILLYRYVRVTGIGVNPHALHSVIVYDC